MLEGQENQWPAKGRGCVIYERVVPADHFLRQWQAGVFPGPSVQDQAGSGSPTQRPPPSPPSTTPQTWYSTFFHTLSAKDFALKRPKRYNGSSEEAGRSALASSIFLARKGEESWPVW
jgi:hypothetical protein